MTVACAHCTGSHYLGDLPTLGPCVCCTPEALTRAEVWDVSCLSLGEMLREIEARADSAAQVEEERDELLEHQAEAATHLQTYLVRQGFSSNPVTLADPDLWALCGLLLD